MILYFTGTGNSYQLARVVADEMGDQLLSLNDRLREHDTSAIRSDRPLVFVTPIYCGRIPRVVEEHIRATEFLGTDEVYFVATCFQTPYKARHYVERLCADKGWTLKGFDAVPMPQNYVVMYETPTPEQAKAVIEAAVPTMHAFGRAIRDGKSLDGGKKGGGMMSDVINPVFYKTTINAKGFRTTDACVGCGTCARACPLGNIRMVDGRPAWGGSCTHCMACIDGCPSKAIEFKDKTVGRSRYWNSSYTVRHDAVRPSEG